ncbi:MAG: glycoside hydrolase family 3 C-terminal domain-containing protein, partial [Clostridia bacterium]
MNDYEREHNELMRSFGAECAVLLKTNGAFPLDSPCRLALFGSGARRTIKGGTGSGEVNSRYYVTAEQGLEAAGFTIVSKNWMDSYENVYASAHKAFIRGLHQQAREKHTLAILENMGAVMPEPEHNIPLWGRGEAAVYVLSRISGEGSDRRAIPGDILLTASETRDILALNAQYEKFLLVLNVGGVVDLSPVAEVGNILLLSQLGVETGSILADLILGKSVPSGKLTTTWSAWEDYQTIGDFGDREDTRYREGVYVGYRYFDTVGKKALFPFGFGLSYTGFEVKPKTASKGDGRIGITVQVGNTGSRPGKEVVQLYISAPQGRLDKPYQELAAFAKTGELRPGEEQELTLSFDPRELASYDEERACRALEPGDYVLRLGTSSVDTKPVAILRLDGEAVVRQLKNCLGKPDFTDWKPEDRREAETPDVPVIPLSASDFKTETVDYALPEEIDPEIEALSDGELAFLNIGAFDPKGGAMSVIGNAAQSVAGAAGETTGMLKARGVPPLIMADGPAGLRLSRQYTKDEKGAHAVGESMP